MAYSLFVDKYMEDERNMRDIWKKGMALLGVCIIIGSVGNFSVSAEKTVVGHDGALFDFFGLKSIIHVDWDANQTSEPLVIDVAYTVGLQVSYSIFKGFFGQFILWYYNYTMQYINVTLEIEDKPSWCTVYLTTPQLQFPVMEGTSIQDTSLFVSVNEQAPAFEPFVITIKASVDTMMGPFGFLSFIQGYVVTNEIYFMAGYHPGINVTPENYYLETTPGTPVTDPITVENLGNGKTLVDIQIIDLPQGWNAVLSPSQLVIEVDESSITNLTVIPPYNFYGMGTIELSFTPRYYNNPMYQGGPTYINIVVEVKP